MSSKRNKSPPRSTAPPAPSVPTITQTPFPRMEPPHMYMTCSCRYHPIPFPALPHEGHPAAYQPGIPPFPMRHPVPYHGMMPINQDMNTVPQPHLQPPVMYPSPGLFYDRRNMTSGEAVGNEASARDRLVELHKPIALSSTLKGSREFRHYPVEVTTEDFYRFLEHGCIIAEQIAIKNDHRPCFRNIATLCDQTRGEIIRPVNTAINIHSQGLPWAAKDFIYAYVRLVNSWHMLKNYVDSTPGSLGWVELELTPEFRNTFTYWERSTKELASHLIRIFTDLNESIINISTPMSPPVTCVEGDKSSNIPPLEVVDLPSTSSVPNVDQPLTSRTDESALTVVRDPAECTEIEKDSNIPPLDNELPSSTSLPNSDRPSTNKMGAIKKQLKERYEKKPKSQEGSLSNKEFWPDNQSHDIESTLPYVMSTFNQSDTSNENSPYGEGNLFPVNRYWPRTLGQTLLVGPVGVLKSNTYGGSEMVGNVAEPTMTKTPGEIANAPVEILWEYETGGLTPSAIIVLQSIVDVMNKESLTKWLAYSKNIDSVDFPTQLGTIREKVTGGSYRYVKQFVGDMKRIISNATHYCELQNNKDGIDQLAYYDAYFSNMISREFQNFDFSHVGDEYKNLGPLVPKKE